VLLCWPTVWLAIRNVIWPECSLQQCKSQTATTSKSCPVALSPPAQSHCSAKYSYMLTQRKSWLSLAAAAAAAVLRVAVPRFWDPLLLQHLLQVLLQVLLVWHCCCCTCSSPWKGTPSDTHCIPAAADRALATWACLHPACVPPTLQCLRCPTLQACQIPTGSIQSLCTPSCIQSLGSCVPRLQGRIQHTVPSRSHNVKCCMQPCAPAGTCHRLSALLLPRELSVTAASRAQNLPQPPYLCRQPPQNA
jgi:hypothetical protein